MVLCVCSCEGRGSLFDGPMAFLLLSHAIIRYFHILLCVSDRRPTRLVGRLAMLRWGWEQGSHRLLEHGLKYVGNISLCVIESVERNTTHEFTGMCIKAIILAKVKYRNIHSSM